MEDFNEMNITELQPGTTLNNGKYTIEKKIGEGGFGITYKAVQNGLGRIVCIKEYFPSGRCVRDTRLMTVRLQGMSEDMFEKYRQAFVREAKTLAALHHPNIVEVIDVFDENKTSYMVMPFIEGRSLQSIVEKNGKLSYSEAVNYIAQVTGAVGYIHERHILHRDIKPDNIMITSDYRAILIDFGSAREFQQNKTQAQTSMLTHGYAPTEQYTTNSRKGSYTDIYAIGATLYFVLTGQVPLEAAARMTEKMPEPKELSPDIPEEANRTILKAMQIKAENRHQTVQEFMDDLLNVRPSELVDETIGGTTVVVEKWKKWIWWVIGGSVLGLVLLVGIILWNVSENRKKDEERISTFLERYDQKLTDCDFFMSNIYVDKRGDTVNAIWFNDCLKALKEIEDLENDVIFEKTGRVSCFQEKLSSYQNELSRALEYVSRKYAQLEEDGLTDNVYAEDILKRRNRIESILQQSREKRSAIEIK